MFAQSFFLKICSEQWKDCYLKFITGPHKKLTDYLTSSICWEKGRTSYEKRKRVENVACMKSLPRKEHTLILLAKNKFILLAWQ